MTVRKTTLRTSQTITAQTDLVTLLAHLVKFPTLSSDPETNQAALDWVKYQLRHLPLKVHDYTFDGFPSVVFTTRPTKQPKLLLIAHMDVVPGPSELFELHQSNGRLYGRGVFDMKHAIAVYMKLFLELGDGLKNYDLGLVITSDEETGGHHGMKRLVEAGWRMQLGINPDATTNWDLEQGAKGTNGYEIESYGEAGHGSRPWAFRNSVVQLMAFLQELRGHFPAEPCGDANHRHNTLSIGTIAGGQAHNQVPDFATASVDIRTLPEMDSADMGQLVREVASHYETITVKPLIVGQSFHNDPDHEYLRLAEHIITRVTARRPRWVLSHGSSDSRYFSGLNIPIVVAGPAGGAAHGADEWLSEKGLGELYRVVEALVDEVAKTK
jgi:succinyl-diaminopimelate desuccinylase